MTHIIIDGYNVIGTLYSDMKKTRDDFLDLLINYKSLKDYAITVVFDGYKSGASSEQVSIIGGIKVIYSKLGIKADDVIKKIIFTDKKQWLVVSSDRDIVNYAWTCNCIPVPSDIFWEILSKYKTIKKDFPAHTDEGFDFLEDIEKQRRQIKGNAYKLSKKDKALNQSLLKLK